MTKAIRFLSILFSFVLAILIPLTAYAATSPHITVSSTTAEPEKTASVDIKISGNPGIMAMAFCAVYDNSALEYTGYAEGYPTKYTLKDHADKGYVSIVIDESNDNATDGTIISLNFKIKNTAKSGEFSISLANIDREKYGNKLNNSFSNSNEQFIVPTVTNGSITVNAACKNSDHKYGEWQVVTPADCSSTGTEQRVCTKCGYAETREIPITHDFEDEWTVDKAAAPDSDGVMSRHCKRCNAVTDKITFTYKEVEADSGDKNQSQEASAGKSNEKSSSLDTAASNGAEDNPSPKAPINNTVGAKNPLSAVERIEDYIKNIKPSVDKADTPAESNGEQSITDYGDKNSESRVEATGNGPSYFKTVILIISVLTGAAVITVAIVLAVRRKKQKSQK